MTDDAAPRWPRDAPPQWAAPSPLVAIVPGILGLVIGVALLAADGPQLMAAGCLGLGAAFVLTGTVALGVAWGLGLDRERRL